MIKYDFKVKNSCIDTLSTSAPSLQTGTTNLVHYYVQNIRANIYFFQCLADDRYQHIQCKILSVLHDDARTAKGIEASQMQCNFAVKAGISGILDLARQTYCEIVSDISG